MENATTYRTAPESSTIPLLVGCVACGGIARVRADETRFCCARCQREQPVERAAGGVLSEVIVESSRGNYKDELALFAESLGLTGGRFEILLRCDGVRTTVRLRDRIEMDDVDLGAEAPGFPDVIFRREGPAKGGPKDPWVRRRIPTDDEEFAQAVGVESRASEGELRALLSSAAVREALLLLLEEHERVSYKNGWIRASGGALSAQLYSPRRIRRALGALRVLAGGPRSAVAGDARRAADHRQGLPGKILLLGLLVIPGALCLVSFLCQLFSLSPGLLAAICVGPVLMVLACRSFYQVLRAWKSRTGETGNRWFSLAGSLLAPFGWVVLVILWLASWSPGIPFGLREEPFYDCSPPLARWARPAPRAAEVPAP